MKKSIKTFVLVLEFNIGVNVIGLPVFYVHKFTPFKKNTSRFFGNDNKVEFTCETFYLN